MAKKNGNTIAVLLLAGVGGYALYKHYGKKKPATTTVNSDLDPAVEAKLKKLQEWVYSSTTDSPESNERVATLFSSFYDAEINDTYEFVFNYVVPGKQLTQSNNPSLFASMTAISTKYNIFT